MSMEATLTLSDAARRLWDVAVVGSGPAGALAAYLLARRGFSIETLDAKRGSFSGRRV